MNNNKLNKIKNGKQMRCVFSGRTTCGREVVLAEYAVLYVKKLGFIVLPGFYQNFDDLKLLDVEVQNE